MRGEGPDIGDGRMSNHGTHRQTRKREGQSLQFFRVGPRLPWFDPYSHGNGALTMIPVGPLLAGIGLALVLVTTSSILSRFFRRH